MIELLIDSRETKIIERLENDPKILEYKTKYLDVGDFILSDFNKNSLIIERKTWADLSSSLKDGRYREQRSRLIQFQEQNISSKVFYIIEGIYNDSFLKEKNAILKLQFVYNIPVFYTNSVMHTINILKNWLENNENLNTFFSQKREIELDQIEARTKSKKKNYADATLYFGECLASIKGLSPQTALSITTKWTTWKEFIIDYVNDQSQWEQKLKELKYKTSKGNEKHISQNVIDKIKINLSN